MVDEVMNKEKMPQARPCDHMDVIRTLPLMDECVFRSQIIKPMQEQWKQGPFSPLFLGPGNKFICYSCEENLRTFS